MIGGKSVYLTGFMGSGKTTVGKLIAEKLELPFVDLDQYIENKTGQKIANIFTEYGEERFRKIENDCLLEIISPLKQQIIALGGGTICYYHAVETIKANGFLIYLKTDVETLRKRLLKDSGQRPLLSGEDLKAYIEKKLEERRMYYEQSNYTFDATGNPEKIANEIAGFLCSIE
jgi:shikimate kinase